MKIIDVLKEIENEEYYLKLNKFLDREYNEKCILPPRNKIFNAIDNMNFEDIKIVIIGQDPYPTIGHANGLAFSVNEDIKLPKSLINIFKELENDLGIVNTNGDLTKWKNNGILLLNRVLTVQRGIPQSHENCGWEKITEHILKKIDLCNQKIVFILWGKSAQTATNFIKNKNRLIINSSHPSPLSAYRSFFGSKPFSRACDYLNLNKEIWSNNE